MDDHREEQMTQENQEPREQLEPKEIQETAASQDPQGTQERQDSHAPEDLQDPPDRPEYLFANETKITRQMARVMVGNRYRRAKAFQVVVVLFCLYSFGFGIYYARQGDMGRAPLYLLLPVVVVMVNQLRKARSERILYDTMRRITPEGMMRYGFSETGIGRGNRMPYAMLTDVDERPEGWLLYIEGTSMFIARDGFFKGTPEDFGPFIARKFAESRKTPKREEQTLPLS